MRLETRLALVAVANGGGESGDPAKFSAYSVVLPQKSTSRFPYHARLTWKSLNSEGSQVHSSVTALHRLI